MLDVRYLITFQKKQPLSFGEGLTTTTQRIALKVCSLSLEKIICRNFLSFIKGHSFPGWDKAFISIKYQIKIIIGSFTPSFGRLIALLVRAMG